MRDIINNAYESIKGYVPDDAKTVIENERKRINQQLDKTFDDIKQEFTTKINASVASLETEINQEIANFSNEMGALTEAFEKEIDANDAELQQAVGQLKQKLDQYDKAIKTLAGVTRTAITTAASSAGLPLPLIAKFTSVT